MSRKSLWATIAVFALLVPATARAQFKQGDFELTLTGSGASDKDFDSTALAGNGSIGYFFTDQLEIGFRQTVAFSDDGDSNITADSRVALDFNFDLGKFVPFVGGTIGYKYGDGVNDAWIAGPEGGLKYFVNATTFIYGAVAYDFDLNNGLDDGAWFYALGIGFRF
jgi:hypothetical protein